MSVAIQARRLRAPPFLDPSGYARHRLEATLPYQLVGQHFLAFSELRAEVGRPLPAFVQEAFEAYLECGGREQRFLRVPCEEYHTKRLIETTALLAEEVLRIGLLNYHCIPRLFGDRAQRRARAGRR